VKRTDNICGVAKRYPARREIMNVGFKGCRRFWTNWWRSRTGKNCENVEQFLALSVWPDAPATFHLFANEQYGPVWELVPYGRQHEHSCTVLPFGREIL
jgi:hypothetical protein